MRDRHVREQCGQGKGGVEIEGFRVPSCFLILRSLLALARIFSKVVDLVT